MTLLVICCYSHQLQGRCIVGIEAAVKSYSCHVLMLKMKILNGADIQLVEFE